MESRKDGHDSAYQNEFTEEDMASPEAREEAAHDAKLDPQGDDPEHGRTLIKGERLRSTIEGEGRP